MSCLTGRCDADMLGGSETISHLSQPLQRISSTVAGGGRFEWQAAEAAVYCIRWVPAAWLVMQPPCRESGLPERCLQLTRNETSLSSACLPAGSNFNRLFVIQACNSAWQMMKAGGAEAVIRSKAIMLTMG